MFDSYIVSNTKTSLSMPLACPPPRKLKHSKGFKRFAFTLAETLITLTIIGVIAALTVPNLLNKYTKHTYVIGLKKAYSQLQNAMKMIPITEGCSAGDYDCAGMFDSYEGAINIDGMNFNGNVEAKQLYLISKNLKTQKYCAGNISSCGINYPAYNNTFSGPKKSNSILLLSDGMVLATTYRTNTIFVDVNGTKGPNIGGRDIFSFFIADKEDTNGIGINKGTIIPYGSKMHKTYNNQGYYYWQETNLESNCIVRDAFISESFCTGRVLEEDAMNY